MSDTYDHDIAEQRDATLVTTSDAVLPEQFKTVLGKMVKLVGKPFNDMLALITYSTSKMQGNVLINSAVQDVEALLERSEKLYEEGFLENENFEERDSIILPLDGMIVSDELKGVIIDRDLRSYTNGVEWLLNPESDALRNSNNIENALRSVLEFVRTMKHLRNKGVVFDKIDGHQFFFNIEYGEFQFVFDGVDIAQAESVDDSYDNLYQDAISRLLLYLLIGVNPGNPDNTLVTPRGENTEEGLAWDEETNSICGSQSALLVWDSLPENIRRALFDIAFAETGRVVTLDEWELLFCEAIADVEVCPFCGHNTFKTAKKCIFCSNTTEKADLLTKWLVESISQPNYLRIAFGRGTTLPGEILGIKLKTPEFMRLMYNSKTNALGLKNLSNISWFTMENGTQKEIVPGKVALIEDGLELTFDGYPDISMRFLGYETK
ncbi:hypothetical protein ACTNEW_06805 [Blautia sp. HCP3S3_G3]|uniref:hypothetical protein n=1 Tax=Blautia sp. HCP3S3_G3 TaxID=3438913 RepID=UPI003F885FF4